MIATIRISMGREDEPPYWSMEHGLRDILIKKYWSGILDYPDLERLCVFGQRGIDSPLYLDEDSCDGFIIRHYTFGSAVDVYHLRYTAAEVATSPTSKSKQLAPHPCARAQERQWHEIVLLDGNIVPWSLWKHICELCSQKIDWEEPKRGIPLPQEHWHTLMEGMPGNADDWMDLDSGEAGAEA